MKVIFKILLPFGLVLLLTNCIFDSDDDDTKSDDSENDPVTDCDVPVFSEDGDDVTDLLPLFSFFMVNDDDQEGFNDDHIGATIVNHEAPVDIEGDTCDEDDTELQENIFDLSALSWRDKSGRLWLDTPIAPNEVDQAIETRNYFFLQEDNSWSEVSDTNEVKYTAVEKDIIETHLGVERRWIADEPELKIEVDGVLRPFQGDIDNRDVETYRAWVAALGLVRDADNYNWAIENEHIENMEFSEGAEVHYVFKHVLEQRYQVEQVNFLGQYKYLSAYLLDSTNTDYALLSSGVYLDVDSSAGIVLQFTFPQDVIINCDKDGEAVGFVDFYDIKTLDPANLSESTISAVINPTNQINDIDPSTGERSRPLVTLDCHGDQQLLMIEMSGTEKQRAGMDGSYDLFLVNTDDINDGGAIYYGKRYNVTTSDEDTVKAEGLVPALYYNQTAIDDIKNIFKTWRDEDYDDAKN